MKEATRYIAPRQCHSMSDFLLHRKRKNHTKCTCSLLCIFPLQYLATLFLSSFGILNWPTFAAAVINICLRMIQCHITNGNNHVTIFESYNLDEKLSLLRQILTYFRFAYCGCSFACWHALQAHEATRVHVFTGARNVFCTKRTLSDFHVHFNIRETASAKPSLIRSELYGSYIVRHIFCHLIDSLKLKK